VIHPLKWSKVIEWSSNKAVFFTLFKEDGKSGSFIYVRDREFEYRVKSIKWCTNIVDEENLVSKVVEHVSKGERVLVVRDKVKDAVDLFNKLDVDKKVLVHGRLCVGDTMLQERIGMDNLKDYLREKLIQ
jgi:CRISPR/Cas system-associated endonuclease/helicase Cas3